MRILIATDAWHPQVNGVVRTLTSLARAATTLGAEIEFLTPEGFPSFALPTYPGLRLALPNRREIARRIEAAAPEAIHIATEGPIGWAVRGYCLRHKLAFTTSYTTRFPEYVSVRTGIPTAVGYAVMRHFHSASATIMVATNSLRQELGQRGFRKLGFWTRGVDTELFRPDDGAPRDPSLLLCVGRASDPNKGVRSLIEALAQVPPPARLVLVDDAHRDNPARGWAERAGVAARVEIAGRVDTSTLVSLYRRAALVVVPSRYEGFGLPAVEAMACGTPVVANAAGALPEVVSTGGGGVLVDAARPDALARAIRSLLADVRARAELGAQGRKGVEAAYAWPRVAARTAEVYAELVAARRGRPASTSTSAAAGQRAAS